MPAETIIVVGNYSKFCTVQYLHVQELPEKPYLPNGVAHCGLMPVKCRPFVQIYNQLLKSLQTEDVKIFSSSSHS